MPGRLRVALLIESSRAYGRGLLRGIADFAKAHGDWSIFHQERSLDAGPPDWFKEWRGDGVIARIETKQMLNAIKSLDVPAVDLRGLHDVPHIPLVETNDKQVMRLAVEHLIERGFKNLAYCGFPGTNYSVMRREYLENIVGSNTGGGARLRGLSLHVFSPPESAQHPVGTTQVESDSLFYEGTVARWLETLPKPVGVVACNDIRGQQVLNVCREIGVTVPEQVAVVGVDNDELLCELSDPHLSSVAPDTQRIGYKAAELLSEMMLSSRGSRKRKKKRSTKRKAKSLEATTHFVDPLGVVTRQSTDVLAIADPQVAAAVRYIRVHAVDGISVEDVLDQVTMSRSTLERRFNQIIGRSPKAEIIRVRLERVKRLLEQTGYSLAVIARMTGFQHGEYMSVQFREKVEMTPGQYREKFQ
jgi:LacI family transcriptional regulator